MADGDGGIAVEGPAVVSPGIPDAPKAPVAEATPAGTGDGATDAKVTAVEGARSAAVAAVADTGSVADTFAVHEQIDQTKQDITDGREQVAVSRLQDLQHEEPATDDEPEPVGSH
jgi:hypothetical protein